MVDQEKDAGLRCVYVDIIQTRSTSVGAGILSRHGDKSQWNQSKGQIFHKFFAVKCNIGSPCVLQSSSERWTQIYGVIRGYQPSVRSIQFTRRLKCALQV